MKRIAILIIAAIVGNAVFGQTKDSTKRDSFLLLEPVEIKAIRAGENSPFTKTNLTKKQIEKVNLGQDLPLVRATIRRTDEIEPTHESGIRRRPKLRELDRRS